MKKLKPLLDHIYEIEYKLTPSETMISQRERNELKYNLLEAFVDVLIDAGIPADLIHRTSDGYIFELQNLLHGRIPIEIDVKVKNMDYIVEEAIEDWEMRVAAKKEKERQEKLAEEARLEREQNKKAIEKMRKAQVLAEYEKYKSSK